MNNRINSKHLVWLLFLLASVFALAACERPLNESDEAVTGTSNEESTGDLTTEGESPEQELPRAIVPPTPETMPPDGESVSIVDTSEGTATDAPADEGVQATEDVAAEDSTQLETEEPFEEASPELVHTVQMGDNLYRIGLQYGCTIEELAIFNEMANPDYIDIGDEIRIPPDCAG